MWLNQYFGHVYIINLEKRPDRLLRVLYRMRQQGIDAQIVPAIDGSVSPHINDYKKYVHRTEYIFENISKQQRIPNCGAWGYLLSWRKVLLDAKQHGYKDFICFDDDVIFQRHFRTKFRNFIRWIPDDWKILNLGATQYRPPTIGPNLPFYHPHITDGSFATGVSHSIYDELLSLIEPMDYAFDSGALTKIYQRYPDQVFVAYPNLVIADVTDSNIRDTRLQESMAKKVGWDLTLFPNYDKLILPMVSIIVSAYNAEGTIETAIRSLQRQTYPSLEIIVIDDCSEDRTAEIIQSQMKGDRRIILIQNETNIGCYASRNRGIKRSIGHYITFHDADDYSLSYRIERQMIAMLQHNVLFTTCLIIRSHLPNFDFLKKIYRSDVSDHLLTKKVDDVRVHVTGNRYEYCCKAILGMVTTLFPRKIFEELGLYWELPCIADAEFCERLLYHRSQPPILFRKDESVVTFLSQNNHLPNLYYKVPEVLYISQSLTPQNITTKYKRQAEYLHNLKTIWRDRLLGIGDYQYPQL